MHDDRDQLLLFSLLYDHHVYTFQFYLIFIQSITC